MASAPQLPLFYQELQPLSSELHADFKMRQMERAPWLATQHAIPLTVEEFPQAQRNYPIVFSSGGDGVPIALMGLNEGINVFVDGDGTLLETDIYLPAYVRRYPFMLARLTPDAEELSLCFDPKSDAIGAFDEGNPLFDNAEPTEATKAILSFNESFEQAGQRTAAFMAELKELDLLMEGEVAIQPANAEQPFIYRGFQMVNEEKLADLRGDQLRKMTKSGLLPLIYAHLFSLPLMSAIFNRQVAQGKQPEPAPAA
ncbi:MAG: SapC family protein [Pseudomonadota bacterium]